MTHNMNPHAPSNAITAADKRSSSSGNAMAERERDNRELFGDIPEAKRRKFILVDDPARGARVRVRVTLDSVDIKEIPDSFRKSNSVYPRSWFPIEMQSPPPSARGTRFFESDDDGDGDLDMKVGQGRPRAVARSLVNVPMADGSEAEVATPRMRRSLRRKEVKLNDLGYRMSWHQSRVFNGRAVFLQKACMSLVSSRASCPFSCPVDGAIWLGCAY